MSGKVGFIGAGQMASALIAGFVTAGVVPAAALMVSDRSQAQLDAVSQKTAGVQTTTSNKVVVQTCDMIWIAVKPQVVPLVMQELGPLLTTQHTLVSICAGVTTASLEAFCPVKVRVVRVMPNTPCLVGAVAAGFSLGAHCVPSDAQQVSRLLGAVGVVHQVPEKDLDAVTGLSGSGPAYVFAFIEALADGGVYSGLPRGVALSLAAQTVFGASKLLLETGKHPGQLKDAVCSPGGTTITGMAALERNAFRGSVIEAVFMATQRSKQLGKPAKL